MGDNRSPPDQGQPPETTAPGSVAPSTGKCTIQYNAPILPAHNMNTNSGNGLIIIVNKNQGGVTVPITNSEHTLDNISDHQGNLTASPPDQGQRPVGWTVPSSEADPSADESNEPIVPAKNINTNSGSGIVFVVNENQDGVTVRITNSGNKLDNEGDNPEDFSPSPPHQGQPQVVGTDPGSVVLSTGKCTIQSNVPILPAHNMNTNSASGIIFVVNKNQGGVTVPITNSGLKKDKKGDHRGNLSASPTDQGQPPVTTVGGTDHSSDAPSADGSNEPILPAHNINTNSGSGIIFVVNKNQGGVTVPIANSGHKSVNVVDHQGTIQSAF